MNTTRNIYERPKFDYNNELKAVDKAATTPYNKRIIKEWHNTLSAENSGQPRICKLSMQIRKVVQVWHYFTDGEQDLNTIDKKSFEQVVGWINQHNKWSLATRADYRRCIKQFFGWYEERDTRLQEVPEIDITAPQAEQQAQYKLRQDIKQQRGVAQEFYDYINKNVKRNYKKPQIDASDVLTDADIRKAIEQGAKNSRDRAFIGVLHESGFRAAEILNLRIKDVSVQGDRAILRVNGKTGRRSVPIILNMPYLLRWIADHPLKDLDEAYLWVGLSSRNKEAPLFHGAVARMMHKAFTRAGINKRHNLHWFRHSRASLYYGRMTEGEMCDFFGWGKGSDMIKNYCHTSSDGAEAALNRIYNLKAKQEEEALLTCAACGLHNTPNSRFCGRCGQPLSTEAHKSKEEHLQTALKLMKQIYSDDKLRQEFEAFCTDKKT